MNGRGLPGVYFRPALFQPTFHKHAGVPCGGCQIHVTDRRAFRPVAVGAALLREFHDSAPTSFAWRPPPYEYEHDKLPIDILSGSPAVREQVENQTPLGDIVASWKSGEDGFRQLRSTYLLYPSKGATSVAALRAGDRRARPADLIRVAVRVLHVDVEPDQDAVMT
jgi:uncharacterized protein YbbC (DUF1343 family)